MIEPPGDSVIGAAAGRRRYLTVMFSDLSDSTRLAGLMEAEDFSALLATMRRHSREIIAKHGGRIARIQSDGVLAIFGFPEAGEDDGRRATEAAIELHEVMSRLVVEAGTGLRESLALHTGIHAGLVFLTEGDVERGRFEVLGTVPNAASRLSDLAARGAILVSEETLGAEAHFFDKGARYLVDLPGLPNQVAVYQVLGRASVKNRFEARAMRGFAPLAGREDALRSLRSLLREAIAGTPQYVAVVAGPGLGKSRLIEELLRPETTTGCMVLRGYCESYLGAEPLQPFLQMLRSIFRINPEMPAADASLAIEKIVATPGPLSEKSRIVLTSVVAIAVRKPDSPQVPQGGTITAIFELLGILAAAQPLLIVLDDWQWADDASQNLLDAIRLMRGRILVLMAMRSSGTDDIVARASTVIELQPLNLQETARTVEHLLPGADPFIISEIHRYAGGIPLFIEELCHSMAAGGGDRPLEQRLVGAAWLNALIESRVARLPDAQAEIVRTASVIGNVFPAWLLERVTGFGEHDPLVRGLASLDFLFPAEQAGMLRFKHGITRDVVYEAIGVHQRKAMHLQLAAVLGNADANAVHDGAFEALAYHYAAAGVPGQAAKYAELAGDKAMAAPALDRARAQYAAALSSLDRQSPMSRDTQLQWCGVAQKLGMACVFDPLALADGLAIFERAVALAKQTGDVAVIARAEYWLGYICYAKGFARRAARHCEVSLELATAVDDLRLAAQVRATFGQVLVSACEYDRGLVLLDSALDSKRNLRAPGSSVAVGSAYTLACKGCVLGDRGRFDQAEECFKEAMYLLGDTLHQVANSVRGWISAVYMWQGRWEEALQIAEGSARIAEHVRSRQLLAMSRALGGYCTWTLTRDPAGLQSVREAISWIETRKGAFLTSLLYGWLVDGALATGDHAEARRQAARLFMRARQSDRLGEAMGCRALARRAAMAGDHRRADHYLRLAMRAGGARESLHEIAVTQLYRAEITLERGEVGTARRLVEESRAEFERMGMRWHLTQAEGLLLRF